MLVATVQQRNSNTHTHTHIYNFFHTIFHYGYHRYWIWFPAFYSRAFLPIHPVYTRKDWEFVFFDFCFPSSGWTHKFNLEYRSVTLVMYQTWNTWSISPKVKSALFHSDLELVKQANSLISACLNGTCLSMLLDFFFFFQHKNISQNVYLGIRMEQVLAWNF